MTRPEQPTLPDPEAVTLRPEAPVIRDQFDEAASMYVHEPDKLRALGSHMRELAGAEKRCGTCAHALAADDPPRTMCTAIHFVPVSEMQMAPEHKPVILVSGASGPRGVLKVPENFSCALWTAAKGGG